MTITFSKALNKLKRQSLLLTLNPEIPDFTDKNRPAKLIIQGAGMKIAAPLSHNREELLDTVGAMQLCFDECLIIGWNIKPLFSYFKYITKTDLNLGRIWDLKILERFQGIEDAPPSHVQEAIKRLQNASESIEIYTKVYAPLIQTVLPQMETTGLAHQERKKILHAYYEPEGQANGRLRCSKAFSLSYLPHTLGPEDKKNLLPVDYDDVFVYFDFKNMEVAVLQWLSGDKKLKSILSSGDAYENIWRVVTTLPPDELSRKRGKLLFLPVVYGLGPKALAKKFKTDEKTACDLINRLNNSFPTAFAWIESQDVDSGNFSTDHFGRRRKFEKGDEYKVRNFSIQAPASTICLKKLVKLYEKTRNFAKLCFHLHDGFGILVNKNNVKRASNIGTQALESSDDLFLGLNLKVTCTWGRRLDQLKTV